MKRVNMTIRGQVCSVMRLAMLLCNMQPNTAVAQQARSSKQAPNTQTLVAESTDRTLPSPRDQRTKTDHWFPQDIDGVIPQVAPGVACPLTEVLSQAGKRIEELVGNVDKFTATEVVEHQSVNRSGQLRRPEIRKFSYLVSIAQTPNGQMNVEEYRNGGVEPRPIP